jgi:hypothetical protein
MPATTSNFANVLMGSNSVRAAGLHVVSEAAMNARFRDGEPPVL